jgi:hypothetical protein
MSSSGSSTYSSKTRHAQSIVASWRCCLDVKYAYRPLLLIPMAAARRAIET